MSDRIKVLAEAIEFHRNLYYKGEAEISDHKYDALEDELRDLDPDHYLFTVVGSLADNAIEVAHQTRMLSLEKLRTIEDVERWRQGRPVLASFKVDGSSGSLVYRKSGELLLAKTRGDGLVGSDITSQVIVMGKDYAPLREYVSGDTYEMRGEFFITQANLDLLITEMIARGLTPPKRLRNTVAGALSRQEHKDLCKYISFVPYQLLGAGSKKELSNFSILKEAGYRVPEHALCETQKEVEAFIEKYILAQTEQSAPYLTDGIVFALNDIEEQEARGYTSHHPKGKISYKLGSEVATTKIKSINIQTGRTGKITFVGIIEPVELSGAVLGRCTLHNAQYILDHKIQLGVDIEITRSGEIIPTHVRTLNMEDLPSSRRWLPEACPSCNTDLVWDGPNLMCKSNDCFSQKTRAILHWTQKIGIDDIGEKQLYKLWDAGYVRSIPDLYALRVDQLLTLDKVGESLATKLVQHIQNSKTMSLAKFLGSCNVVGGGERKFEKLVKHYPTLDEMLAADAYSMSNIRGFGDISAAKIVRGIRKERETIDALAKILTITVAGSTSSALNGMRFVITGKLSKPRKDIEAWIKERGGEIGGSISKTVSCLVCNEVSTSGKYRKAMDLGIKIVTEDELYQMEEALV